MSLDGGAGRSTAQFRYGLGKSNGRTYAGARDGGGATGISASTIGGADSGVTCTREPSGDVGSKPKAVNGQTRPKAGATRWGSAATTAGGGTDVDPESGVESGAEGPDVGGTGLSVGGTGGTGGTGVPGTEAAAVIVPVVCASAGPQQLNGSA